MNIEDLARKFEEENPNVTEQKKDLVSVESVKEVADIPNTSTDDVVGKTKQQILQRAQEKIKSNKIIEKHAKKLAQISDDAIKVDSERADLKVRQQDADNKVEKQEIKNRLIVLKAEATRLKKEQQQLNREQRADHKARNKAAKWDLYKGKLGKMGYDYVPNVIVLSMLLFFDSIKSFFDGVGAVSTAAVKALKWVLLIGAILIVLFSVPVTRNWLINLLN